MNRTSPYRLVTTVSVLLLFYSGSIAPAQDGGTMILITPVNGVANSFELVRVHPDKVEVRRQGIRLNFSRDAIKSVKNADAARVLEEANAILDEAGEESVEKLPELLERAERTVPRVEGVVQKFDWLVPEATGTLADIRQALFALRDTSRSVERLEMLDTTLEEMVEGATTLSATWERIVDQGLEVSKAIPFPGIQEEFRDRLTRKRREIRLDLSQRRTRSLDRIRKIGDDLLAQVASKTLSESRLKLAISELDRLYEGILDPGAKEEIADFVAKVRDTTTRESERLKRVEAFTNASEVVQSLREGLDSGTIAPVTGERVHVLERAKGLIAALPESPTKEIMSVDLSDLEVQVAQAMAASVAQPPMVADGPPLGPSESPLAPDISPGQGDSLLQTLTRSLGWGVALSIGVIAGLIGLMVFAGRIMKKRKQAKIPLEAPDFANQYDIFESESKEGSEKTPSTPAAIGLPPEPAPPQPVEDPFGFSDEESETEALPPEPTLAVEMVPDDPFDMPPEGEVDDASLAATATEPPAISAITEEEDPFGLSTEAETVVEEEDVFGAGEANEEIAPVGDTPPMAEEDDPFGLTAGPEPQPEGDLESPKESSTTSEPDPAPTLAEEAPDAVSESPPPVADDPLGLNALSTPTPPEPPAPETPSPNAESPPSDALDDDPFGFNDMLSESEGNSDGEDDLFADLDSKD